MPNCDFYAAGDDTKRVLDFVFAQAGWTLYELASRHDQPLRRFTTHEAVTAAFNFRATDVYLQLYAEEMRGKVYKKKITFRPGAVPGATYRYDSSGWGLIQLYLVAPHSGQLKASHTNHNSEARARKWEPTYEDEPDRVDDWDWKAVTRTSSQLNRFVRGLALSRFGSRPVLPVAHERNARGTLRLTL